MLVIHYLIFQYQNITKIETKLNKSFIMLSDWFVDNELSIHFGEDKTKSILLGNKHKIKNSKPLNIQYNDIEIKQYSKVIYLVCILDKTFSGESMTIYVINKRLRFLYRQNRLLNLTLRRLLYNAMIQPFFEYPCNTWHSNVNKKLKMR